MRVLWAFRAGGYVGKAAERCAATEAWGNLIILDVGKITFWFLYCCMYSDWLRDHLFNAGICRSQWNGI